MFSCFGVSKLWSGAGPQKMSQTPNRSFSIVSFVLRECDVFVVIFESIFLFLVVSVIGVDWCG